MRAWILALAWLALSLPASAQDVDALERALEKARLEAPLVLKPFMLVTRPAKYFGDYEQRTDAVLLHGDNILFYLEIKNLVIPKNAQGLYEPAFEVDLEISSNQDKTVRKTPGFAKFRLPGRSRVQDFYVNLLISLDQAPPATYTVRFTVRDLNSKKTGTVEQVLAIR
jgi:hypothetical protein